MLIIDFRCREERYGFLKLILDYNVDTIFRSYFIYDAVLDLAIKYFNGMAVKSFDEATLKNQFAIESRTEK